MSGSNQVAKLIANLIPISSFKIGNVPLSAPEDKTKQPARRSSRLIGTFQNLSINTILYFFPSFPKYLFIFNKRNGAIHQSINIQFHRSPPLFRFLFELQFISETKYIYSSHPTKRANRFVLTALWYPTTFIITTNERLLKDFQTYK